MTDVSEKVHGDGSYISTATKIVDYDLANKNILVRGSAAFGGVVSGTSTPFKIGDLVAAIEADDNYQAMKNAGITLNANPNVVDFCLIGFAGEGSKDYNIVQAELAWFNSGASMPNGNQGPYPTITDSNGSNQGSFVYWPIQAIGGAPGSFPTKVGDTWPTDPTNSISNPETGFNYMGLIPAIRGAVTNDTSKIPGWSGGAIQNSVIYFHCDSGVNRTGAACVGYLMTYGSNVSALGIAANPSDLYTLKKAERASNKTSPSNDSNPPGGSDIPVAQAYCNYHFTSPHQTDAPLVAQAVPLFNSQ